MNIEYLRVDDRWAAIRDRPLTRRMIRKNEVGSDGADSSKVERAE